MPSVLCPSMLLCVIGFIHVNLPVLSLNHTDMQILIPLLKRTLYFDKYINIKNERIYLQLLTMQSQDFNVRAFKKFSGNDTKNVCPLQLFNYRVYLFCSSQA